MLGDVLAGFGAPGKSFDFGGGAGETGLRPNTFGKTRMSNTLQELENFTYFVKQKLSVNESKLSLEECVRMWRQQTERQATLDDVRQGQADAQAGLSQPLADAVDDIRQQLGFVG